MYVIWREKGKIERKLDRRREATGRLSPAWRLTSARVIIISFNPDGWLPPAFGYFEQYCMRSLPSGVRRSLTAWNFRIFFKSRKSIPKYTIIKCQLKCFRYVDVITIPITFRRLNHHCKCELYTDGELSWFIYIYIGTWWVIM